MVNVIDRGWQNLGEIAVETGHVALFDPGDEDLLAGYRQVVEAGDLELVHRLAGPPLGRAVGLVVATGMGDGLYPVEGRIEEVDGEPRIAELRVRFLPHPVIGYDLAVT